MLKTFSHPPLVLGTAVGLLLVALSLGGYASPRANADADYSVTPVNFPFIDISSAGTNIGSSCDDCVINGVAIGFSFNFYGAAYTRINISSNGNAQFTSSDTTFGNSPLPAMGGVPAIMPFFDDLRTDQTSTDAIHVLSSSERFIVQWTMTPHFGLPSSEVVTFQLVLLQDTNDIIFVYPDVVFAAGREGNNGGSATVGIQGHSANFLQYSFNQPVIADGSALLFTNDVTPPRVNVGGAVGAVGAAAAGQAAENRARAAAAAAPAPQPVVQAPRTGTGVTIAPPNTGDAGLADENGNTMLMPLALATTAVLLGGGLRLALKR